jgi:hypothetical protein
MTKINQALSVWQPGDVHTLKWFALFGIQQRTAHKYAQSGSLKKIGAGVFARTNDRIHWAGAVRAMQEELNFDLHIAGSTALYLQGLSHNIALGNFINLITYKKRILPKWVQKNNWRIKFALKRSSMFKTDLNYEEKEIQGIKIKISSRELAILEFISDMELTKSFESIENQLTGLTTLRSKVIQQLLENCQSIKVKRVFLYLSEQLNLPYFSKLNIASIDLGSGKRTITKNGKLNKKYLITVPKNIEENPF